MLIQRWSFFPAPVGPVISHQNRFGRRVSSSIFGRANPSFLAGWECGSPQKPGKLISGFAVCGD